MKLRKLPLAIAAILLAVHCSQKESPVVSTAGTEAAPSPAVTTAAASPAVSLVPQSLITVGEAAAILGEAPTFETEAMPAYADAVGFNYHTKGLHYLSAAFYPGGGVEMFNNMKRDLPEAKKLSETPCSGIGDQCIFSGSGAGVGMLHAVKGTIYFTLSADVPASDRKRVYEDLGRKVAGRLP
jgi:hypothetical protein